ncbi:EscU/YscU/HrcU family type III secretion system export apparatus switch protein [Buchnera aphidicola (Chaitoregma tattakana)]|uniref:EscU/YscU/HrcU family type III secretion system export apparatus switch protein n=1 Tax=Buchnera aphidicola TaxID=9 RepID=UPI0031B83B64
MSENNVDEDKTEDPSEHKIKKSLKDGKRIDVKEFNFLLFLCVNFIFMYIFRYSIYSNSILFFTNSFKFDSDSLNKNAFLNLKSLIEDKIFCFLYYLFLPFLANLLIPLFLGSIKFNINNISLNFNRLNIFSGFQRLLSYNILVDFIKILMKFFFISFTFVFFLHKKIFQILHIFFIDINVNILYFFKVLMFFCLIGIISFIPISIIDFVLEYNRYYKSLRMSKYEVLEEFKEIEGNPNIKSIIRRKRKEQENAFKSSNISEADVILIDLSNNFCVAIKYDSATMHAPKILRKNTKEEIDNIKKIAISKNIPVLKDSYLTTNLYTYGKSGGYIPEMLYLSISEVIAWSDNMKRWMKIGGVKPIFKKKFNK